MDRWKSQRQQFTQSKCQHCYCQIHAMNIQYICKALWDCESSDFYSLHYTFVFSARSPHTWQTRSRCCWALYYFICMVMIFFLLRLILPVMFRMPMILSFSFLMLVFISWLKPFDPSFYKWLQLFISSNQNVCFIINVKCISSTRIFAHIAS